MTGVKWISDSGTFASRRSATESRQRTRQSQQSATLPHPMVVAIWYGLVTGLLELGLVYARNHIVGFSTLSALQISRHFPWMIPLANLVLFLAWGLVVVLLGRVWKRIGGQPTVALLSFPACLAPLLLLPGLYWTAYLALAGGFATLIGRVDLGPSRAILPPGDHEPSVLGHHHSPVCRMERRARSLWPSAGRSDHCHSPSANGMNVIFLVMDTVRADRLSLYGYQLRTTPNLERIAGKGVRFDQAQATAPWTLPSHASMFTGLWPHQTGVSENRPLDATCPTLAEFLTGRGYLTAGFVANTYFCNSWFGLGRGFSHYEDFYDEERVVSVSETLRSSALGRGIIRLARLPLAGDRPRKTAAQINRDFLDWLAEQEAGRPFFVFLNYFDAHSPYIPPRGYDRRLNRRAENPAELALLRNWDDRPKKNVPESEATLVSDAYDDCIGYLDFQIGELADELERRRFAEEFTDGHRFGPRRGTGRAWSLRPRSKPV